MMRSLLFFLTLLVFFFFFGCSSNSHTSADHSGQQGFEKLSPSHTGIEFVNQLTETDTFNYFKFPYIYMGGGVSIADFNNDGLQDLFFTGNMVPDKIYRNKGAMKFEDVTRGSGLSHDGRWHTGTTVIDINGDDYPDIYVSVSGPAGDLSNLLYINQGDMTFKQEAQRYGIDDPGNSIQSTFFDFDNDGDLDLYVANYPITSFKTPNYGYRFLMKTITEEKSDRLYRNNGDGKFEDVTRVSGLLTFGLTVSATVADFNGDNWQDIYVSNDFSTPDYLFINNQDGTFTEHLKAITKQTSFYSMGADAADVNNDGLTDFFQVDMSAEDNRRSKANMASMDVALFWSTVNSGFHYQYMYNSFQLNRGISDGLPFMSNIAAFAGVSSTDWSWSALLADFDNDGWKDLFVTNGTRREINNKDYFNRIGDSLSVFTDAQLLEASLAIPSEPISNYLYINDRNMGFKNQTKEMGMSEKGFSNGCAYGDLDNDGDLDLVVNNIDSEAWVYQNKTEGQNLNFIRVALKGSKANKWGIGSKLVAHTNEQTQTYHVMLSRGFQSSVEPVTHFGLGASEQVDSLIVTWPDGSITKRYNLAAGQTYQVSQEKSLRVEEAAIPKRPVLFQSKEVIDAVYTHKENRFDDYSYQVLLPHKLSNFGPALAVGDLNKDGLEDFFVGGAMNQAGAFYVQTKEGRFTLHQTLKRDAFCEDMDAVFLDIDQDADLDLYVVSGGNEYDSTSGFYHDRLYLNDEGTFTKSEALPPIKSSGSCVRPYDFDQDGDLDLFVGGRLSPRHYPFPGKSLLLENRKEEGGFELVDHTEKIAPALNRIGMVTDALWIDVNEDNLVDLVLVGEWMDILWMENTGEQLLDPQPLLEGDYVGWWFSIEKGDFDGDGDEDLVVGNLGTNYKYQASEEETFDVFVKDFDGNGKDDIILSYYNFDKQFPVRGRQCSSEQIPAIKSAFKDYNSFATATVQDIFGTRALASSLHYSVNTFSSIYMENKGKGKFIASGLPALAQIAPINDMQVLDVNDDQNLDLVIAGNLYASEVETPRADAGNGLVLIGDGSGVFEPVPMNESGIHVDRDTKHMVQIQKAGIPSILFANNNGPLQLYELVN